MTVHALADARSFTSQIPFPCTRLHRRRASPSLHVRAFRRLKARRHARAHTVSNTHTHSAGE